MQHTYSSYILLDSAKKKKKKYIYTCTDSHHILRARLEPIHHTSLHLHIMSEFESAQKHAYLYSFIYIIAHQK